MKKFTIVLSILIIPLVMSAQKWERTYGQPNYKEWANDVIEFYDKGYYILGSTEDMEWNFKTGINGDTLYNKFLFHNLYIHRDLSSVIDENGNLYICGTIILDDAWPIVAKYDSCGQKVWCRVFVDDSFDDGVGMDLLLTENGNIIVLVTHDSDDQIDQILLYCLNNNGNLLWTESYASKNDHPEIAHAVAFNLYYYNNSYFIDGYCYWPYPGNPNHVYLKPLFIKIDSLFNEEWILPFGVPDSIVGEAYGTIPLNDTVYFGIGVRRSSATFNQNSLLMFFNEQGEEIGYNQIPNSDFGENVDFNTMWNIVKVNDTSFITKFYIGMNDTVFHGETVIDTSGTIHILKNQGPGNGTADLIKTSDNNYLEVTEVYESKGDKDIWLFKFDENLESVPFDTNTYVYDSLCPYPIQSGTIDITDCFIWTNIEDTPSPEEYYASLKTIPIKAYPNPSTEGQVTFEFQNTEYLSPPLIPPQGGKQPHLVIYNVLGEKVHEERVYQYQGKGVVDVNGWRKGMYVAVVYSEGLPVGNCKFVIE
ncbi:MAG: hypothetical protein ISS18_01235 [Bacteroidales bacterium]|nr:hypothetical protein [Bacteroidales bacterium]